jgi:hypothetical protein
MPYAYGWIPVLLFGVFGCVGGSTMRPASDASSVPASDSLSLRDTLAGSEPPGPSPFDLPADTDRDFQSAGDAMTADAAVPADVASDSNGVSVDATVGPDVPMGVTSDVAADSIHVDSAGMLPCSALKPLADLSVLGPWKTHRAYYAQDRSWLLLQVHADTGTEIETLIRVDLPSGNTTTIGTVGSFATPLGNGGALLFERFGADSNDLSVFDGKVLRKLLEAGQCHSTPTPDGTRLFAVGPCVGVENGLEVIDVATGTATIVDKHATLATTDELAVSPNGQWVAYKAADLNQDHHPITVTNIAGKTYTITPAQQTYLLRFASDDLLVFSGGGDILGHVPGSGDTSFLIASDRYEGEFPYQGAGYQVSPDRTRLLAAKMPAPSDTSRSGALYSIPLRGGDPLLLVKDWSVPSPTLFAFDSQGKYVVYASKGGVDYSTGLDVRIVSAVDMQGATPRILSNNGSFGLTPSTSSVLLVERDRLRLTDLATALDRLSYSFSSNSYLGNAMPLRGDQAVLFSELADEERALFMSVKHPQSVLLGHWDDAWGCEGCTPMPVAADPTGCFTVVNNALASGYGTRLVLLPD